MCKIVIVTVTIYNKILTLISIIMAEREHTSGKERLNNIEILKRTRTQLLQQIEVSLFFSSLLSQKTITIVSLQPEYYHM